jgi:hypothetical protein
MPLNRGAFVVFASREERIKMSARWIISAVWLLAFGCVCLQPQDALAQYSSRGAPPASQKELTEEVSSLVGYLRKIGEPPVLKSADNPEAHSYRLIWIAVYPKSEIVVLRLEIAKEGAAKLFVKVTSFDGETIILNKEDRVSIAAVDRFLEFVNRGDFWQLPTRETPERLVKDGTYWYLEGAHQGRYHMVYRRAPELNPGRFTDIGRYLARDLALLDDSIINVPRADRSEPIRRARP